MAVDHERRDRFTGYLTTGHEWNGIKELNTPVPRAGLFLPDARRSCFRVGYWVLMPAWPLGVTYTKGLLGIDQRNIVAASLKEAAIDRDVWTRKIASRRAMPRSSPIRQLMAIVRETGHTLFGDNCAACHGIDAKGGPGFPNLTTSSWLWGGKPEDIFNTIRVGINSAHKDSRVSQMPAFGRDQMLPRADVLKVARYVYSLSNPGSKEVDPKNVEAGKTIFAANCVVLSRRRRQGQSRTRRAQSDRQVLDLWRRPRDHRHHDLGRPAGPHADLGRPPVRARSQDPDALSPRQADGEPMNDAVLPGAAAKAVGQRALAPDRCLLVAVILAANAHLVYVATTSQPACVAHVRQGEGGAERGPFSAAQSSCSPSSSREPRS